LVSMAIPLPGSLVSKTRDDEILAVLEKVVEEIVIFVHFKPNSSSFA